MKPKTILLAVAIAILNIGNGYAQITPTIQRVETLERGAGVFSQYLNSYVLFTIDKKELITHLYSNRSVQLRLRIDEEKDWLIDLEVNDMRAPNFRQVFTTKMGEVEHTEFVLNTFRGRTSRGQVARFTIDENNFFGVILDGESHYIIRPSSDYTQNNNDRNFIVYRSSDIVSEFEDFDYIHDALGFPNSPENTKGQHIISTASSGLCSYLLLIATDADYEFFRRHGSNTNNRILSILNIVEGVYESTFGLRFSVVYQHVFDWSNTFLSSFDSSVLLRQFQDYWNRHKAHISRHITHLFTGKTLNSTVVGRAFLGQIGNGYAYSLSMEHQWLHSIVAHEIGHNLNARDIHSQGGFRGPCECLRPNASIMCSDLRNRTSNTLWFCEFSIYEISSFINYNRSTLLAPGTPQNCTDRIVIGGWINPVCRGRGLQIYVANATSFSIFVSNILGQVVHRGSGNITSSPISYPVTIWNIPSSLAAGNYQVQITFSSPHYTLANTYTFFIQGCLPASISGPNNLCTEEVEYVLQNGMATRWFVTPEDAFTIVDYDFTWARVKAIFPGGQIGTLTAVVSGTSITRTIQACGPTLSGPTILCPGNTTNFNIQNFLNGADIRWTHGPGLAIQGANNQTTVRIRSTGGGIDVALPFETEELKGTIGGGFVPVESPDRSWVRATITSPALPNPIVLLKNNIMVDRPMVSRISSVRNQEQIPIIEATNGFEDAITYYGVVAGPRNPYGIIAGEWRQTPGNNVVLSEFKRPSLIFNAFVGVNRDLSIIRHVNGIATMQVRLQNTCGWSNWATIEYHRGPNPPLPPRVCPICNMSPCQCGSIIIFVCPVCGRDCRPRICGSSYPIVFSPNPVSDILTIDLTQTDTDAFGARTDVRASEVTETIFDIRLLNSHGMVVRQQRTQARSIQFDVSNLPEGTYYLHIEHNGEIEMHQIIVQRN